MGDGEIVLSIGQSAEGSFGKVAGEMRIEGLNPYMKQNAVQ
jgi:hypothetical protein